MCTLIAAHTVAAWSTVMIFYDISFVAANESGLIQVQLLASRMQVTELLLKALFADERS
jgi:hypothetical protein